MVLQYNIMQRKSGGTVQSWQQNTISDIGKFLVYSDFFGEDGSRNLHHSDSKN